MPIDRAPNEKTAGLRKRLGEFLAERRRTWLVTGAAGFIGSNLVEQLLRADQEVVGLDNFSTGHQYNLDEVLDALPAHQKQGFRMIEGDIRDRATCEASVDGVEIVLHQAALGSVPRSIVEPLTSHDVNVTGFVNILDAARIGGVSRFVYAASSSTYGDEPNLPKREERIGNPLSLYAATKLANEIYAAVYARTYGFRATGLRYFNVFGPRQDPDGPYAAVIPKWIAAMIEGQEISTATARRAGTFATSRTRSRPISPPRSRPMSTRARCTTSRLGRGQPSMSCSRHCGTGWPRIKFTKIVIRSMRIFAKGTCVIPKQIFRKRVSDWASSQRTA